MISPRRLAPRLMLAATCVAAPAVFADDVSLAPFSSAAPGAPPAAWKFFTLPHKKPTTFTIVELDGAKVLKVEADDSYGDIIHAVQAKAGEHVTLAWRWRVDKLVDGADLHERSGDDSPAKICVSFAYDPQKLPFGERAKLSFAHSQTGQDVPAETLCYVWDNQLAIGTEGPNAFTKRIRFVVLESGTGKLGQWASEKRDVSADYLRLFADEAGGQIPDLSSVIVSADADNTHNHALSYFGDVTLKP